MPSALRAQVALITLLGVLLIPIGTSSLRGLTHILTCQHDVETPVLIEVDEEGNATLGVAQVIDRTDDEQAQAKELCGGLLVDVQLKAEQPKPAQTDVAIVITNNSDFGWRGSVQLDMNGTEIPIDIGEIGAGEVATDDFTLHLDKGNSYHIEGDLLIGP
jgi:hypothetical protein